MSSILGIDVGTTELKATLFNQNGLILGCAGEEYDSIYHGYGMVEFEAERYWSACVESIRQILKGSRVDPRGIISVGISSQAETFVPINRKGRPLRRAIVWLDERSKQECEIIKERFGREEVFKTTGQNEVLPIWTAPKILWLKRNEPDVFKAAYKYLMVEDYVLYKLTGSYVTEGSVVSSSLLFNISRNEWWRDMLETIGIEEGQLPELMPSGSYVGTVTEKASRVTGLEKDTTISTGAYDHAAGAIGAGNIAPGVITETTGTAMALVATTDMPFYDPEMKIPCHKHAIEDKYFLSPWNMTAGLMLKWFRDRFCQREIEMADKIGVDAYDFLSRDASKIRPGSDGLVILPHLMGAGCPEFDIDARGVIFGITQNHSKAHLIRAIMESVAYMLRRNIDLLEDLKIKTEEIISLGGGSRSNLWKQIKADVTQRPVITPRCEESACLGSAILSARAAGLFNTIQEGVDTMVSMKERQEPQSINRDIYSNLFLIYMELYENLSLLFKRLNRSLNR